MTKAMTKLRVPKLLPGMFLLIGSLLAGFDENLLAADAGGLAGIVKDSRGAPLAGVAVSLLRGQFNPRIVQTVTTDGTGRFEMRGVLPGFYSLKASLASYLPFIQSQVGVVAGKIADLTLILENLYLQSILGVPAGSFQDTVREDIESVLRSASSTRPILRVFETDAGSREEPEDPTSARKNGIRGVVGFSTAAYSSTPEFANAGSTFTDFAFIKDVGTSTTWVVAGVVSDSGFAELDSLLRFRASDRHTTSARLSLGILPYVSDPLSPIPDQNVRRLNMYNLDLQDDLKVSEMLSVIYGAELQVTDPSSKAPRFRPRWGFRIQPSAGSRYSFLRTKSLPQMQRTLELGEADSLELTSPFQHDFGNRLNLGLNRVTHTEAETEQTWGKARFSAGVYTDEVASNYLGSNGGPERFPESRGVRLTYQQSLGAMESVVGYTYGSGLQADQGFSQFSAHNLHMVAARVRSRLPLTHTQVAATYRWMSEESITIVDPYQAVFESNAPGLSLAFVQAIPYFGKFIPGKIEAQVDVRNLFGRSNPELYQSASLRRVEFVQPARSVRGGIKLKF